MTTENSRTKYSWQSIKGGFIRHRRVILSALTALFFLTFASLHLRLISDTFYVDPAGAFRANAEGGYGDLPMHMTIISKFAFSHDLDLDQNIYYGSKIRYHFFLDMLRGFLLRLTGAWSASILWPIYILAVANIILIYLIYRKLLKNNALVIASFLIFFLGAGTSAWGIVVGKPLATLFNFNAHYPAQNVVFGPIITMDFTFQHSFLLGLFLFLVMFWSVLKAKDEPRKIYIILAGLALGLLPLSHAHSFVAASVTFFIIIVLHLGKPYRQYLKRLLVMAALAAVLALPQAYFIMKANSTVQTSRSYAHMRLGWMVEKGIGAVQFPTEDREAFSGPVLSFLWVNFGIILPVAIISAGLLFFMRKKMEHEYFRNALVLLLASATLFFMVQLVNFQPWDLDNVRILTFALFLAAPFMVGVVAFALREHRAYQAMLILLIVFGSVLSGMSEFLFALKIKKSHTPVIFSVESRETADFIRARVPEKELVLTGTTHLNPVSSLAGRPTLVGYPGWLWSQGNIDYSARLAEVRSFYEKPGRESLAVKKYPVGYVLVDDSVRREFAVDEARLKALFPKVFEIGESSIYKI